MRVVLVDKDGGHLAKAKEALGEDPGEVILYELDVSNANQWQHVRDDVQHRFGRIDFLMLNAGTSAQGSWGDADYFHKILDTNLYGVVNGLNAFVPSIRSYSEQKPAAIVITGSKQGITNPPGNPAYNASKAAVKSLAEQLDYDFRGSNTSVHLLVPGWTFTGLSGGGPGSSKEKPAGAWSPQQVADYMYQKMGEDKFYIICPDNDVTEDMDKKRMMWSIGDIVNGRPPLSRWRDEFKEEAQKFMEKQEVDPIEKPLTGSSGKVYA